MPGIPLKFLGSVEGFKERCFTELYQNPFIPDLVQLCRDREVVFVFSAKKMD
jgi:hypothetical protein